LPDAAVDVERREDAALDQEDAVALVGALALAHGLEVGLGGEGAALLEEGAQAVLAVGRGRVDDLSLPDVDLLDEPLPAGGDDARHLEAVDGIEDLRQRRLREIAPVLESAVHGPAGPSPRVPCKS